MQNAGELACIVVGVVVDRFPIPVEVIKDGKGMV